MEVADDVFLEHAIEEAAQQQEGDGWYHLPHFHRRAFANAVARGDVDVGDAEVADVEPHQHVVGIAVRGVEVVEVDGFQGVGADGGVAGLGVGDVPVAGGDLGEQGQERVAQVADARRLLPGDAARQAVALAVVGLAIGDRLEDQGQLLGVHLAIARHDRDHLHAVVERRLVTGGDRFADAAVDLMTDQHHPMGPFAGPVLGHL